MNKNLSLDPLKRKKFSFTIILTFISLLSYQIIKSLYSAAETTTSPLVVDLDGDGVETIGTSAGIHFDHDSNGFAEKTGWVGRDDGLLVRDINGNGQIDKLHLKQQECNLNLAA